MPTSPESDRPARRLLVVLAIPLLFAAVGAWQLRRGGEAVEGAARERDGLAAAVVRMEAVAAATPNRIVHFAGDAMGYSATLAAGMMRDGAGRLETDAWLARLREVLALVVLGGAGAALLAGATGLSAAAWAGRRARLSRAALETAFSRIRAILPLLLGAQIGGLTLACCAALLFEVAAFGSAVGAARLGRLGVQAVVVGLAVAGFTLWLGWLTLRELRRSLAAFEPAPLPLFGRALAPSEAPGLRRFIDRLAAQQGAVAPEHVVASLSGGFFVTSSEIAPRPAGGLLRGRTLHVPLPVLAMLDEAEAAAVIGHELAHFAGEDDAYSRRFLPIYTGIQRNLGAMAAVHGRKGVRWALAPAFTLGAHMLDVFDGAVKRWSRVREFEADAASVPAAGAEAVGSALIRTTLAGAVAQSVLRDAAARPRAAPADLVAAAFARAEAGGLGDPAPILQDRQPHPTDTHPPTFQRIAALGLAEPPLARAARPVRAADAAFARGLFADWDGLCAAVGADAVAAMTEADDDAAARLRAAAAASPAGAAVELFRDVRRPLAEWGASGLLMLAAGLFLAYAVAALPIDDPSARPMLGLVAAGLLIAAGACLYRVAGLRRSTRTPFLTLHADGFECRGLDRMVPWLGVERINMLEQRSVYVFIRLTSMTPLPRRVSGWLARVSRRRRTVTLTGARPRGLAPRAFLDLLGRYCAAARARAALEARDDAPDGAPYVAILSEEQLLAATSAEAAPVS